MSRFLETFLLWACGIITLLLVVPMILLVIVLLVGGFLFTLIHKEP